MKSKPLHQHLDFLERCERARDGKLTPEEEAALDLELRGDAELRRLFAQSSHLDAEFRHDPRLLQDLSSNATTGFADRSKIIVWSTLAAAACVLLTLFSTRIFESDPAPVTVATLVKASRCKWAGSTLPTAEGSRVTAGTLELLEGLATLRFDSGAEVVLEAPASVEIIDPMNCRLISGTLVADVPHDAIGFTVDTKDAKVVDLGTRFGVSTGEDGKYMVHVIDGLVEVNHKGESEIKRVTTGQNLDRGLLREKLNPQVSQDEPNRWHPDVIINDEQGWQIVSTAYGRGKDSFVQATSRSKDFGSEVFMRVKNTSIQADLIRKAYVTFDLEKFKPGGFENAEFTLSIEPSDLGFATLVPDSTFSVYGLLDEEGDLWDEHGLTWENAPARQNNPASLHLPDASQAVLLGSFVIPQGVNRGTRSISGKTLADFLNMDSNGLATLIICRETDETSRTGLVHAFSTKENRNNTPPLLRVKMR